MLKHIMTKLRSVSESNPGKLGSAVTAVTPVSEARKQLPGLTVKTNIFFSVFLRAHCDIVKFFGHNSPRTWAT